MWHLTRDTWQVTPDMWHILSKFGIYDILKIRRKKVGYSVTESITRLYIEQPWLHRVYLKKK